MPKEKEQTTIRLPAELKEILIKRAEKRGYPITTLLIEIFSDYLDLQNIEKE